MKLAVDLIIAIIAWIAISVPVAFLVGKAIDAGRGTKSQNGLREPVLIRSRKEDRQ